MSPTFIQTWAFISYCSPVQDRMAGADTGVYEFDSVVGEFFTFMKLYGLYSLMKRCKCIMREDTNKHDEYTVDDQL